MNPSKPVRVYAVASGKGGVGKTNAAINMGISLTQLGHRVALLDADMGLANVDVLLGLHPTFNLSHVLSGERTLDEIMVTAPGGLKIIPASSGIQKMTELSSLEQAAIIRAFGSVDEEIDVLIVDSAAGISSSVVTFARACQEVIVVVCDEPTSLTDAYAFIKLLNRDHGLYRFQVLTNRVRSNEQGHGLFNKLLRVTDRYLDVSLDFLGAVPEDDYLRQAVQKQCSVVHAFPGSPSAKAFKNVARKTELWPVADTPGGQLEFFIERIVQSDRSPEEALV